MGKFVCRIAAANCLASKVILDLTPFQIERSFRRRICRVKSAGHLHKRARVGLFPQALATATETAFVSRLTFAVSKLKFSPARRQIACLSNEDFHLHLCAPVPPPPSAGAPGAERRGVQRRREEKRRREERNGKKRTSVVRTLELKVRTLVSTLKSVQ